MLWTAHDRAPIRQPAQAAQRTDVAWLLGDVEANRRWSWLRWLWRNPATNLMAVVLGVSHRHRLVVSTTSPWTFVPGGGWNWAFTCADGCLLPRPLISYRGRWPLGWINRFVPRIPAEIEVAIGWKTSGDLTLLTVRRAYSPNAEAEP